MDLSRVTRHASTFPRGLHIFSTAEHWIRTLQQSQKVVFHVKDIGTLAASSVCQLNETWDFFCLGGVENISSREETRCRPFLGSLTQEKVEMQ